MHDPPSRAHIRQHLLDLLSFMTGGSVGTKLDESTGEIGFSFQWAPERLWGLTLGHTLHFKCHAAARRRGETITMVADTMTIEQPDKVDFISVERATGMVVLTITDHLDWEDRAAHLAALDAKLASYLEFIESGQLLEQVPDANLRGVRIDVRCLFPPHGDGRAIAAHLTLTRGVSILFI